MRTRTTNGHAVRRAAMCSSAPFSLLLACGPPALSPEEIAHVLTPPCEIEGNPSLRLTGGGRIPLAEDISLFGASLLSGRMLVLEGSPSWKEIGTIEADGRFETDEFSEPGGWISLAAFPDGWVAVGRREVLVRTGRLSRRIQLPTDLSSAATDGRLVVGFEDDGFSLVIYDIESGTEVVRRGGLDLGTVVALAPGVFAMAAFGPPFALALLDGRGRMLLAETPDSMFGGTSPADDGFRTSSILALDCGAFLQVVADLRSDRRWILLYQLRSDGLKWIRTTEVTFSGGMVATDIAEKTLIALMDEGGGRSLREYRWSWY